MSVARPAVLSRWLPAGWRHQYRLRRSTTHGAQRQIGAQTAWVAAGAASAGAAACAVVLTLDQRAPCRAEPGSRPSAGPTAGSLAAAEQFIEHVYRGVDPSRGPALSAEEEDAVDESGGSHIYGEITVPGVHTLIHWLLQRSASAPAASPRRLPEDGWAFADLGSGVGRMCIHVAYMGSVWGCVRSVGIELSHTRHMVAVEAAERAQAAGALQDACLLQVLEGDIMKEPLDGLTVVYVASLLFDDEMLDKLADRLETAHGVQWVATLRRLDPERLNTLQLDASIMVPMSWDEDAEVFLYCRDRRAQLQDYASVSGMTAEEADTRAYFA